MYSIAASTLWNTLTSLSAGSPRCLLSLPWANQCVNKLSKSKLTNPKLWNAKPSCLHVTSMDTACIAPSFLVSCETRGISYLTQRASILSHNPPPAPSNTPVHKQPVGDCIISWRPSKAEGKTSLCLSFKSLWGARRRLSKHTVYLRLFRQKIPCEWFNVYVLEPALWCCCEEDGL